MDGTTTIEPCGRCGDPGGEPKRGQDAPARYDMTRLAVAAPVCLSCAIELNRPLALSAAGKYSVPSGHLDDIRSEAMIGLIEAAHGHNNSKGTYQAYAIVCCHNRIKGYIANRLDLIHVPDYLACKGRTPRADCLQAAAVAKGVSRMGGSVARVPDGRARASVLEDVAESEGRAATLGRLGAALGTLDARARRVIDLRFGLGGEHPRDQAEIGREIGRSKQLVSLIERRALVTLREALEARAVS